MGGAPIRMRRTGARAIAHRALTGALLAACTLVATPAAGRPTPHEPSPASPSIGAPELVPAASSADRPLFRTPPPSAEISRPLTAKPAGAASSTGVTRTLLSLGLVLALIALCGAAFKRFLAPRLGLATMLGAPGKSPAGLLEILGRYPVCSGSTLVLLKLDRRVMLLSQQRAGRVGLRGSSGGLTTLCEVTDPEEVASILAKTRDAAGDSASARFTALLGKFQSDPQEEPVPFLPAAGREHRTAGERSNPPAHVPDAADSLRSRLSAMRSGSIGA